LYQNPTHELQKNYLVGVYYAKKYYFSFIAINLLMLPCAYGETDLEQITVTATAVDRHSAIEIPCQIDTIKAKEVSKCILR